MDVRANTEDFLEKLAGDEFLAAVLLTGTLRASKSGSLARLAVWCSSASAVAAVALRCSEKAIELPKPEGEGDEEEED